jgi:hypothetical protein
LLGRNDAPKKKTNPYSVYQNLYPESVRYALQYREAQLGKGEIRDLMDRYLFEVVYLMVKAYAGDHENQRLLLQDLTRLYIKPDWSHDQLRDLLNSYLDRLPDDVSVTGTKLAQLNRYGSEHWQEVFRALAQNTFDECPRDLTCLVAHTPFIAFHHFVEIYNQPGSLGKLLVLVPGWMQDETNHRMGYEITLHTEEPTVRFQDLEECLFGRWECLGHDCPMAQHFCKTAIFIDDTINTGATNGKLMSFWHTEYGVDLPRDRVRVITDLSAHGYKKLKFERKS